mgnify:CR=1 FL=1
MLDPLIGSGTTAIVCEELGRKWLPDELRTPRSKKGGEDTMRIKCLNKDCLYELKGQCQREIVHIRNDLQCSDYAVQKSLCLSALTEGMKIELFTQPGCWACKELQEKLDRENIKYIPLDVQNDDQALLRLMELGARATPTVIVNNNRVLIGCDYKTYKEEVYQEFKESKTR